MLVTASYQLATPGNNRCHSNPYSPFDAPDIPWDSPASLPLQLPEALQVSPGLWLRVSCLPDCPSRWSPSACWAQRRPAAVAGNVMSTR